MRSALSLRVPDAPGIFPSVAGAFVRKVITE